MKFYKRNGYYYLFAPAGGVATGWQLVLRSKNIYGPYEEKVVIIKENWNQWAASGNISRHTERRILVSAFPGQVCLRSYFASSTGKMGKQLAGYRS